MSTPQEVALGREASAKFEAQYGVVNDPALRARVENLGARLAAQSGRNDVQYVFKVANMKEFNALAFPGGFIYATKGLVEALTDEQLAFVLGHEITHVSHRHAVKQISQDQLRQAGLLAVLVGLSGGSRVPGGSVEVAQLIDRVVSSQYSQADESDADRGGIEMMGAAGIDPAYAILALRTLAKQSGGTPGFLNTLVGSHPLPQERIDQAYNFIPAVTYIAPAGPVTHSPRVPVAPAQILTSWENSLARSMQLAGVPLRMEPSLRNQARTLLKLGKRVSDARAVTLQLSSDQGLGQVENRLLSQDLPPLVRRGMTTYGLSVLARGDGSKTLLLMVR